MTKDTVEQWKREKKILENDTHGYHYLSADNVQMVEFHVDDYDLLHDLAEEMGFGTFGGNLSMRKPPDTKPLMILVKTRVFTVNFCLATDNGWDPKDNTHFCPRLMALV